MGARNPLSIIVPCHRLIGIAGAPAGYVGGLAGKRWWRARDALDPKPENPAGGANMRNPDQTDLAFIRPRPAFVSAKWRHETPRPDATGDLGRTARVGCGRS
ncbi:MAG: MGMT family protein [Thermaerobacter sp.]|nr:MGMT family protein [Thermaerobacter sp.]